MKRLNTPKVRRARLIARVIGAILGLFGGFRYGIWVATSSEVNPSGHSTTSTYILIACLSLAGYAFFSLAAPLLTVDPYLWLAQKIDDAETGELLGAIAGLIVGLLLSSLIALLLSPLPWGFGYFIAIGLACILSTLGVHVGHARRNLFDRLLPGAAPSFIAGPDFRRGLPVLVDTSVLIDGRIEQVASTGFLLGVLEIPAFVLLELQQVADSADPIRRNRGKRGLAVLEALQSNGATPCEVIQDDPKDIPDVDAKLIRLALDRHAALLTADYNLNRIASAQGINVLNLNELAKSLRPLIHTGDKLTLKLTKAGKEPRQGVGYLEDGTMVVVENGSAFLGSEVVVTVSTALLTSSGRMVFAALPPSE